MAPRSQDMSITDGVLNPLDDPKLQGQEAEEPPVSPIAFVRKVQVRALSVRLKLDTAAKSRFGRCAPVKVHLEKSLKVASGAARP